MCAMPGTVRVQKYALAMRVRWYHAQPFNTTVRIQSESKGKSVPLFLHVWFTQSVVSCPLWQHQRLQALVYPTPGWHKKYYLHNLYVQVSIMKSLFSSVRLNKPTAVECAKWVCPASVSFASLSGVLNEQLCWSPFGGNESSPTPYTSNQTPSGGIEKPAPPPPLLMCCSCHWPTPLPLQHPRL